MNDFTQKYFSGYFEVLKSFLAVPENLEHLSRATDLLKKYKNSPSQVFLIGNGGSAAVAEHMVVDFVKCNYIKAVTFSGTPLLTCFANDYGYEHAYAKAIERCAQTGDALIAISSSGTSKNILNACATAKKTGMTVITLSGFKSDNPLRQVGDVNLWVESKSYGYLEIIHNLIIHYINDALYGAIEYSVGD